MLTKRLLSISLFLPLLAMAAATAHAGSTITDKSYWPSEARPAVHGGTGTAQSVPRDAFASSEITPRFQAAPMADEGGNARRYHGGPKSFW